MKWAQCAGHSLNGQRKKHHWMNEKYWMNGSSKQKPTSITHSNYIFNRQNLFITLDLICKAYQAKSTQRIFNSKTQKSTVYCHSFVWIDQNNWSQLKLVFCLVFCSDTETPKHAHFCLVCVLEPHIFAGNYAS